MVKFMLININRNFLYGNNSKTFGSMWNPIVNKESTFATPKNYQTKTENEQTKEAEQQETNSTIVIPADYGLDFWKPKVQFKTTQTKIKSEADKINEVLETKYGIKSDIKNLELLKSMNSAIKDFCDVNENDNLFKNGKYKLVLTERPFVNAFEDGKREKETIALQDMFIDKPNKEFQVIFNSNADNWIEQNNNDIKKRYDAGLLNTDNPNYNFYGNLTWFLLNSYDFKPNKIDYGISFKDNGKWKQYSVNDVRTRLLKLTHKSDSKDFAYRYIVNKMCREPMPKIFDEFYNIYSDTDNIKLKFPQTNEEQIHIKEAAPEELKGISEELKKTYGINADFKGNTTFAKPLLLSVEALTKAANNIKLFNGLDVKIDKKYFEDDTATGVCIEKGKKGEFFIAFNPNYDLEGLETGKKLAYEDGTVSSNNIVHSCITHELAHWLQWGYRRNYSYNTIDKGIQFINKYKDGTIDTKNCYRITNQHVFESLNLSAAAKVSAYATTDVGEFCSEYIAGRMDGKKYPKLTDVLFETLYRGPKLNFPCNDK